MQPIYQNAKFVSNLRMTLTNDDIRKLNLKILIKEIGKKSTLAQLADTDPAYISQVLSTKSKKPRNIGENLARKLEIACGKNRGWMDVYHPDDENTNNKDEKPLKQELQQSLKLLEQIKDNVSPRSQAMLEQLKQAMETGQLTDEMAQDIEGYLKTKQATAPLSPEQKEKQYQTLKAKLKPAQDE